MKEKVYKVTFTKSQLRLVAEALEDWHRFLAGQCELWQATSMLPNYRQIVEVLNKQVKPLVTPELSQNASYSWDGGTCSNEHQRKAIAMSYGIYREIYHYFANQPPKSDWNCYQSETLRCEEQGPLIKIEEE